MSAQQLSVTILGSNSALPANNRNPTAQLLNSNGHYYLIDCGEGTQMQLRKFHLKMQRIKVIFISHLHGDHYYGLLGLMNSMHLLGRTAPLVVVAPARLQDIIDIQMDAGGGRLHYPVQFISTDHTFSTQQATAVYEDTQLRVSAFPLKHRIPCTGFRFTQRIGERTYLPEEGGKVGVRIQDIPSIKAGQDFTTSAGRLIPNAQLTVAPPLPKSYGFCTDTLPLESTSTFVSGSDALYHEATFAEDEVKRARETYHSTALQAAGVAKKAEVSKLIIGHFSARYHDLDLLLSEAREVFPNTVLAEDGLEVEI